MSQRGRYAGAGAAAVSWFWPPPGRGSETKKRFMKFLQCRKEKEGVEEFASLQENGDTVNAASSRGRREHSKTPLLS